MNPLLTLLKMLALVTLTGSLAAQAGLSHEVGWLPEPTGSVRAQQFVDMNGDTFADLVRLRPNAVELLLQDPVTGRFARVAAVSLGVSTTLELRGLAVGHLDGSGDALPDVAVVWSNGDVDVLHNVGGASLVRIVPRPVPALPAASGVAIFAADVSGDLLDDLIVLLDSMPPQYLQGQASGLFQNVTSTNIPNSAAVAYPRPRALLADVDGDQDLDLVLCSINPLPPRLLRNQNGSLVLQANAFPAGGLSVSSVLAIDLAGSVLPELIFGSPGTAANTPTVLANVGGTFTAPAIAQNLRLRGVVGMAQADINQDGFDDVVFLEATGKLGFALRGINGTLVGQPTGTAAVTEPFPLLTPNPQRLCFAAADIDGDGDCDITAAGECPDSLLLHGPGGDFHDTERFAFPITRRGPDYAAALVDRDHNGDIDFVGLYPTGEWQFLDNDGSGYFTEMPGPVSTVLPPLTPTTVWREVMPMSVATPGRRDLLAFGNGNGVSPQVAVLINTGSSWVDDTLSRFGGPATGTIVTAEVFGNGSGRDHLILGTSAGELEFHENVGGTLVYQSAMFPPLLGLWSLSSLIVADFSGDGLPDVLALSAGNTPPRFFLAGPSGFTFVPLAVPFAVRGDHGIAANLDHDNDPDVLLRTAGQPGVTALRWNQVSGSFSSVTLVALSLINFVVQDMAMVRVDGSQRIVLARNDGLDVVLAWNGNGYHNAVPLSYRGTPATRGLLTADLERDGDVDILVLREGLDPVVINNETIHLQQLGPLQSGRAGDVLLGAPAPGSLAFISYGLPMNTLTPWGLLRLNPATIGTLFLGVAPASRQSIWHLSLGPGLPRIRFPIQAAWITPTNQIVLSGLEHLVITP